MEIKEENKKVSLSFAALNPYVETNQVLPTEVEAKGQNFIQWGDDNTYPSYLHDLYASCNSLKSIINSTVDYVLGDGVKSLVVGLNDEKMEELIRDMMMSYCIYGGFALNIIRNKIGGIAEIHSLDFRNVRSSKKGEWLYYSEDFGKKSLGRGKYISYPKFNKDEKNVASSILYYKNVKHQTYPSPIYGAAITSIEVEKAIDEYHMASINNGFMGGVLISLNNGIPTDEDKEEIERGFNEKFGGYKNGNRMVISYADTKDNQATIEKIDTEDFGDKYKALAVRASQQIFTSFRCHPILMGFPTENLGFSDEPFDEAFKLFNRTVIKPLQRVVTSTLKSIYGVDAIKIIPFTIDWGEDENKEEVK